MMDDPRGASFVDFYSHPLSGLTIYKEIGVMLKVWQEKPRGSRVAGRN